MGYSNRFLVGLLNSNLFTFFYRLVSTEVNRTLSQIKPSILEQIPVSKEFNNDIVIEIELLTNKIIEKIKTNNLSFSKESKTIDQLVYKLYGLTEEEIRIVEG